MTAETSIATGFNGHIYGWDQYSQMNTVDQFTLAPVNGTNFTAGTVDVYGVLV